MALTLLSIIIVSAISIYSWNNQGLIQKWIFNPYQVYQRKEYYRFLTSGFLHKDITHLVFNMIALYFFGEVIEKIYTYYYGNLGYLYYIILFYGGIIISDIPTFLKHKHDPYYNSLGASGGVSAVLFAAILFQPTSSICLYFAICLPAFIMGALYLIYSYYQGRRSGDGINHNAHLFGALYGIAITILIKPNVIITFFEKIFNGDW